MSIKKQKRVSLSTLLCLLLAAALSLTFFVPAFAAPAAAVLTVGQGTASQGENVTIPITLESNPGLAGLIISIDFDTTRLRVESAAAVRRGPALSGLSLVSASDDTVRQSPFRAVWFGIENDISSGVILNIEFTVLPGAPEGLGFVSVSAEPHNVVNADANHVPFAITQGGVNVTSGAGAGAGSGDTTTTPGTGSQSDPNDPNDPNAPDDPEDSNDPNETNIIPADDIEQPSDNIEPYTAMTREVEIRERLSIVALIHVAFYDVSEQAWYYNAINFVAARRLFEGVGDNRFAPAQTMTRAMFVTVLSRIDGINSADYTNSPFTDVDIVTWYGPAVTWARQSGIIDDGVLYSIPSGEFRPNENITREQMAVIFANYLAVRDFGIIEIDVPQFYDISDASPWAREAIHAMRTHQIIQGIGENRYNPLGDATRAEVAQIFTNLVNVIVG